MSTETNPPESPSRGLAGSLRVVAGLCVAVLAILGVLRVLELVPPASFTDVATKVVAVGAIAAVATLLLGLLSRR